MRLLVCNRCKKELPERSMIRREIRLFGKFLFSSEEYDLCGDCMKEFKRFMSPIKKDKEADDGNE